MRSNLGTVSRPQIKTPIPGPNAQKIVEKDHRYIATTTKTSPIAGKRGLGCVVEDVDGNLLLDFTAGIGVLNLGHCHPAVTQAVARQIGELVHFAGTDFYYEVQAELARRLETHVGGGARKTFYTNSGAESNEAAIKVAKWATGRQQFLAFQGAFHGRTAGAGSLTASKPVQRKRFFPLMPGVIHVPFANPYRNVWGIDGYTDPAELTERTIGFIEDHVFQTQVPADEVAAIFVEPIQGEGGYVVPPKGFYARLKKLCASHGILFVADEVQSGFGRTGKWFGIEHEEVQPDIMSLAKAIANGFPMGACVYRAELDFGVKGAHSNTYGGNVVACTAALAVMDVLEREPILENVAARGKELKKGLAELQEDLARLGDIRGRGLMVCADFVTDPASKGYDAPTRDRIVEASWKRGLMLLPCGRSGIRFIPPLVVTQEQVEGALEVFGEAVKVATK